ncbi:MAG: SDR family NAD(P)-dependent oxidoreductase [Actinomycetota bacterium]|nr:SDR family NAD(P)-dependent oxidoreductase [Actinomycetota bacterium]
MSDRFAGQVAIVTGGGSGIGRAVVDGFVAGGGSVVVVGRRAGPLQETVATSPKHILAVPADIGEPGAAARIVAATLERFGHLDLVVNNAGRWDVAFLSDATDELIVSTLMTNLFGAIALIRESLDELRRSKGSVVNISSTGTKVPLKGNTVYAATKAALEQVTRNLALELGRDGVRVNAVAPGATETDMVMPLISEEALQSTLRTIPMGRIGTPEDIARVVLFLASPEAGWVTGQTIQAAGGQML